MKKLTEDETAIRRSQIVAAAKQVFFRYGFARATLGDIAEEAKLARPAVYQLFAGKDELFDAVLQRHVADMIADYRKDIARLRTLRAKLLHCVKRWAGDGFALTTTHPDARDAFNMAYPAVQRMYEILAAFYAELLADAGVRAAMPHKDFARLLIFSLRGIKDLATDATTLRELVTHEVDIFLAAVTTNER